jgi:hypothetical protein
MKFRPGDIPFGDPDPDSQVQWEDNWLSNNMAWFSHKFLPAWCQTPEHWTSRFAAHIWTDCPCCLAFRGLALGGIGGFIIGAILVALIWLISNAR